MSVTRRAEARRDRRDSYGVSIIVSEMLGLQGSVVYIHVYNMLKSLV